MSGFYGNANIPPPGFWSLVKNIYDGVWPCTQFTKTCYAVSLSKEAGVKSWWMTSKFFHVVNFLCLHFLRVCVFLICISKINYTSIVWLRFYMMRHALNT